jgi:hypothetical protein
MSPEWDDKLSTKAIYIDHQEFEVRWNLYSALLHLRRVKPRELFWIDIICIDQSNVFERNSQLSHMRRIYQSAQETIIWFGPAVVSTKVAIERMTRFYANLSKNSQEAIRNLNYLQGDARASLVGAPPRYDILNGEELCSALTTLFKGLDYPGNHLLAKSYCHVRRLVCALGFLMATCLFLAFDNQNVADRINLLASSTSLLIQTRTIIQSVGSGLMKLLDIIAASRSCKTTDPRDKIHAMLGIVEDLGLPFPDYNLHAHVDARTNRNQVPLRLS